MPNESDRDQSFDQVLKSAVRDSLTQASAACLDAEKLAAWSEGALPRHEADDVESHLAGCARCQAMTAVFARTIPGVGLGHARSETHAGSRSRWTLGWLVPLVAAIAMLVWIARPKHEHVAAPAQMVARVEAPAAASASAKPSPVPVAADTRQATQAVTPPVTVPSSASANVRERIKPMAPRAPASTANKSDARGTVADAVTPASSSHPPAAVPVEAPHVPVASGIGSGRGGSVAPAGAAASLTTDEISTVSAAPLAQAQGGSRDVSAFTSATSVTTPPSVAFVIVSADSEATLAPRAGSGGGGRGRGASAGRAGGSSALPGAELNQPSVPPTRWRVFSTGNVERSTDGGGSWDAISIDPPLTLTGGVSPSASVCWLIGRNGAIVRTSDGVHFERVPFPETTDLSSIRATDARHATVTTADGRVFTTTDAGVTWQ